MTHSQVSELVLELLEQQRSSSYESHVCVCDDVIKSNIHRGKSPSKVRVKYCGAAAAQAAQPTR